MVASFKETELDMHSKLDQELDELRNKVARLEAEKDQWLRSEEARLRIEAHFSGGLCGIAHRYFAV